MGHCERGVVRNVLGEWFVEVVRNVLGEWSGMEVYWGSGQEVGSSRIDNSVVPKD